VLLQANVDLLGLTGESMVDEDTKQ
jgi:hypothetical protein